MYPKDLKYSKDHEWLKIEGTSVTIGITEYAQHELGEIIFVELPEVGTVFDAHAVLCSVESVKAVSEVFTPISGEVTDTNGTLDEKPELLNTDPHGEGWIVKLAAADIAETDELMDSDAYEKYISEIAGA